MSKYAVALFFLLFGLQSLVATKIPEWVIGVVALIAGVTLLVEAIMKRAG